MIDITTSYWRWIILLLLLPPLLLLLPPLPFEGRFYLIQVYEVWILDTVKFSPLRQVSLMARVLLREVSLRN